MKNRNLSEAKKAKNDEFYTQLSDIENELQHYKSHFEGKTVLCNCDDPEWSNFWLYFSLNFDFLGLKKLISIHYEKDVPSYKLEITRGIDLNNDGKYNQKDTVKTALLQNGDFRSPESIELLQECDIVCTNPPFSLFREYIDLLMKYEKKFLVIGNMNAITYKGIFNYIKDNEVWLGINKPTDFKQPDEIVKKVFGVWFTNLPHNKRNEKLILYRNYNENDYPKYDNYDAVEVSRVADIPIDYKGVMGVPITFLSSFNPEQFEIVTLGIGEDNFTPTKKYSKFRNPDTKEFISDKRDFLLYIRNSKGNYLTSEDYRLNKVYARILIKNKN